MAEVIVRVSDAPELDATDDIVAQLDSIALAHRETLQGCPLYVVLAGTLHVLGLKRGDAFTTRQRDLPHVELPLRLFTSCGGFIINYGVDPLPEEFVKKLGEVLDTIQFSFTVECDGEFTECTYGFTPEHLAGYWSTSAVDAESGETTEIDSGSYPPPKKASRKKGAKKPDRSARPQEEIDIDAILRSLGE